MIQNLIESRHANDDLVVVGVVIDSVGVHPVGCPIAGVPVDIDSPGVIVPLRRSYLWWGQNPG